VTAPPPRPPSRGPDDPDADPAPRLAPLLLYVFGFLIVLAALAFAAAWLWRVLS
jgi:hypothetical protein